MRINIILVVLFWAALLPAQEIAFKLDKSAVFKDEYKNTDIVLADENGGGGIVVVRSYAKGMMSPGGGYYFEQYDSNMKMTHEFEYAIKSQNTQKNHVVLGLVHSGNNINIVGIFYDLNVKAFICEAHSVDINTKQSVIKELFRVGRDEIKPYGTFSLQQLFYNEGFKASPTPFYDLFTSAENPDDNLINPGMADPRGIGNRSGVAFSVNPKTNVFAIAIDIKSKNASLLKLFSFESNLTPVTSYEIKSIISSEKSFQTLTVDQNAENLYVLSKVDLDAKKTSGAKYNYELIKISRNTHQTVQIETDEHFIPELKTKITPINTIACVGLYSDTKDNQYSGICYFETETETMSITKNSFNPFPAEFIVDKYGAKKPKELKHFNIRNISFTADNAILIHAEEAYITVAQHGAAPGMGGGSSTFYNYDDIMVAKMNLDGTLNWARNISKGQSSSRSDTPYLSYSSVQKNGNSYFFINAAEKVKKLDDGRITFGQVRANKSNLYLVKIDSNSNFDYVEILDDQATEVPFMVARGIFVNDSIYFLGQRGSSKQLLKVTID